MEKAERLAIRGNFVLLTRELPLFSVLSYLHQEKLLSRDMVMDVIQQPFSDRNSTLLFIIFRSGPNAFSMFVDALRHAKRQDLANVLTNAKDTAK